ncbi:MAG: hypothetical protein K940chlam3_01294 [Chlamydiae bacterium]|nr:hypothetical protein [Chlamydiota bacterium]
MAKINGSSSFFKNVMKVKVKKKKKMKVKGPKKIKPKKKDKNILRVFTGQRDMSQDTASKNKWIKANLEGLSSKELERLKKKIGKIAAFLEDDQEIGEQVLAHKEVILEYAEFKLVETEKNTEKIRGLIKKRISKFPDLKQKDLTPRFVRENFADIKKDYEEKVVNQLILPKNGEEDSTYFILKTLKRYL